MLAPCALAYAVCIHAFTFTRARSRAFLRHSSASTASTIARRHKPLHVSLHLQGKAEAVSMLAACQFALIRDSGCAGVHNGDTLSETGCMCTSHSFASQLFNACQTCSSVDWALNKQLDARSGTDPEGCQLSTQLVSTS